MTYTIEQIQELSRSIVTLMADGDYTAACKLTTLLNSILTYGKLLDD